MVLLGGPFSVINVSEILGESQSKDDRIGHLNYLACDALLDPYFVLWLGTTFCFGNEVELGELLLSLNYLPSAGRLNVDIIRAKQLLQTDMSQGSDPFVKIQLVHGLKLTKTKKTSCMRGTIDPFYNESFSFKVPQEELENASLVFTVYGHNVKSSNDFIGRIVIGQYSTGAPESNHWRRMLNAHRTAVEQWHSLRSREECDRVSPASLEVT
uniref:Synaptotagmin-17 n=1 Tax=Anas platyrhynchos platyrhynchos TaxID=8840 RepID=A0A493TGT2_ANAPP